AIKTAPVAQNAVDIIGQLYEVEARRPEGAPLSGGASRAPAQTCRADSGGIQKVDGWADFQTSTEELSLRGIRYTLAQWDELGVFLDDARVPLDNNASERALRRVALGRRNYLFVGNVAAGQSLAGLYSLVATCESRGINPYEYLTDVLRRVQDHPAKQLDELLPGPWAAAR